HLAGGARHRSSVGAGADAVVADADGGAGGAARVRAGRSHLARPWRGAAASDAADLADVAPAVAAAAPRRGPRGHRRLLRAAGRWRVAAPARRRAGGAAAPQIGTTAGALRRAQARTQVLVSREPAL